MWSIKGRSLPKEFDGKTTILLVEQNAAVALNIAQHGYVLETGQIVLPGEAQKLLKEEKVKQAYLGV